MALSSVERPTHALELRAIAAFDPCPKHNVVVMDGIEFPPAIPGRYNVAVQRHCRSTLSRGNIMEVVRERLNHNFRMRGPIEGPDAGITLNESLVRMPNNVIEDLRKYHYNVVSRHHACMYGIVTGRNVDGFDVGDVATLAESLHTAALALRSGRAETIADATLRASKAISRCKRRTYSKTYKVSHMVHLGTEMVRFDGKRTLAHQPGVRPLGSSRPVVLVASGEYSGRVIMGDEKDIHILYSLYPKMFAGEPQAIYDDQD